LITSDEWISGTPIHTAIDMRGRKGNLLTDSQRRRLFMDESRAHRPASGNGLDLTALVRSIPASPG
jgi:hypothetical protein